MSVKIGALSLVIIVYISRGKTNNFISGTYSNIFSNLKYSIRDCGIIIRILGQKTLVKTKNKIIFTNILKVYQHIMELKIFMNYTNKMHLNH